MKIITLFVLTVIIHSISLSCDCKVVVRDSAVSEGLKNYDLVFTGDLITSDYNKNLYSFEILELFKGNFNKETVFGIARSNCSIFPREKGIWIVYANIINDSTIEISSCSHSVSLKRAEGLLPPPVENSDDNMFETNTKYKLHTLAKRTKGIAKWFTDYQKLKKFARKNENKEILKEENETESRNFINFRDILLTTLILINIYLLILLFRRKRTNQQNHHQ